MYELEEHLPHRFNGITNRIKLYDVSFIRVAGDRY